MNRKPARLKGPRWLPRKAKSPAERGFLRRCTVGRLELVANSDTVGGWVQVHVHVLTGGHVGGGAELGLGIEDVNKPLLIQGQRSADLRRQDELGIDVELGRRATRGGGGG